VTLHTMMRVAVFGLLAFGAASSDAAGEKNMESLRAMDKISKEIQGVPMTPANMQAVAGDLASYYAPKVDCTMTPSNSIGFEMKGVTFAECCAGWAKSYANIVIRHWSSELAVVPGSGGKTVLVKNHLDYTVTATGEAVSGPEAERYKFNDAGLIISIDQEFDRSKFDKDGGKSFALAEVSVPTTSTTEAIAPFVAVCFTGVAALAVFVRITRRQQDPILHGGYQGLAA